MPYCVKCCEGLTQCDLHHSSFLLVTPIILSSYKSTIVQCKSTSLGWHAILSKLSSKHFCEKKLMTFSKEKIWYECHVFSRSRHLSSIFFHHQFLLSVWRIGPEIMFLQNTLFAAANPASTQELKPIEVLSFSTCNKAN